MIPEKEVYSRIGMALVSTQRVEWVVSQIIIHLAEYDAEVYGISGQEFLSNSQRAKKARKTLGEIFKLFKLTKFAFIEVEMDEYLKKRNDLVHQFWRLYLDTKSETQARKAIEFCNEFGKMSDSMEKYFKGFIYFLALRHVKDRDHLDPILQGWSNEFDYFITRAI